MDEKIRMKLPKGADNVIKRYGWCKQTVFMVSSYKIYVYNLYFIAF